MATLNKGRIKFEKEASDAAFGYLKGTTKWAELLSVGLYGTYGVKLYGDAVLEMETELQAMLDSAYDEVIELGKKATKAEVFKEDEEGVKHLAFKLPEKDFEGKPNKITMYDVGGSKVDDWDKLVGNGSTVKIKYRVAPYYMSSTKVVGLSYKFYAVQVIDLKEFSKSDSGFGDETGDGAIASDGEDFQMPLLGHDYVLVAGLAIGLAIVLLIMTKD